MLLLAAIGASCQSSMGGHFFMAVVGFGLLIVALRRKKAVASWS